ncbi:hypothetical protein IMZ48_44520 [Candidatus Bathyarchaeota archaeon]|nr:hypothetical protein [Candidatus Bathyarchaeota archaeon]
MQITMREKSKYSGVVGFLVVSTTRRQKDDDEVEEYSVRPFVHMTFVVPALLVHASFQDWGWGRLPPPLLPSLTRQHHRAKVTKPPISSIHTHVRSSGY